MKPDTTERPPLVLFGRYGNNFHRTAVGDDHHHFVVADISERRAAKINKKPDLLGYSTRNGSKSAKQQEQKWIDICLDRPRNRQL